MWESEAPAELGVAEVRQEPHHTSVNIFATPNRLKNNGRARLLPSWRRNGSAGASPSRRMNLHGQNTVNMATEAA